MLAFNDSIGYEPITGRGKAGCIILPVQLGCSKKVASLAVYPLWITAYKIIITCCLHVKPHGLSDSP